MGWSVSVGGGDGVAEGSGLGGAGEKEGGVSVSVTASVITGWCSSVEVGSNGGLDSIVGVSVASVVNS